MARLQLLTRRPAFARLFFGETISQLGDWMSWVALSLLALDAGGGEGALAFALVLVAHSLPAALLSPVAGVLADRFDRRRLLVATHLVQGVLTAGMAVAAVHGALWTVQALLWARAALSAVAWSARSGAVQATVEPAELLEANALSASAWSVTFAAGMALGGVVALAGPGPALWVDAATFALAAGVLLGLPALPGGAEAGSGLREALVAMRADPELRTAVLAKAPLGLAGGGALVLLGLVTTELAGLAALGLGLLQAAKGIATGVGPLWAERRVANGQDPDSVLAWADGSALLGMVALAALPGPAGALVAVVLWGLGSGSNWVLSTARLQQLAPSSLVGRLAAADGLLLTVATSLGALAAGVLVEVSGTPAAALVAVAGGALARLVVHAPPAGGTLRAWSGWAGTS